MADEGKAQAIIYAGLSEKDRDLINEFAYVKEAIDKLKMKYEKPKDSFSLHKQITELKWSKTESADEFINKLNEVKRLTNQQEATKDDKFMTY